MCEFRKNGGIVLTEDEKSMFQACASAQSQGTPLFKNIVNMAKDKFIGWKVKPKYPDAFISEKEQETTEDLKN